MTKYRKTGQQINILSCYNIVNKFNTMKGMISLNKIAHSTTFCSGRYHRTAPLAAKQHSKRFSFRLKFCALRHGKE